MDTAVGGGEARHDGLVELVAGVLVVGWLLLLSKGPWWWNLGAHLGLGHVGGQCERQC